MVLETKENVVRTFFSLLIVHIFGVNNCPSFYFSVILQLNSSKQLRLSPYYI